MQPEEAAPLIPHSMVRCAALATKLEALVDLPQARKVDEAASVTSMVAAVALDPANVLVVGSMAP